MKKVFKEIRTFSEGKAAVRMDGVGVISYRKVISVFSNPRSENYPFLMDVLG